MDGFSNEQQKEVPAPPAAEVSIRTMKSDMEALEKGGGEMAAPKTFSMAPQADEGKFGISGYAGPEKPIFSAMPGIGPKEEAEAGGEKTNWLKFSAIAVVIIIAVVVVGFLAYYIFSKWIFPAQMPAV